MAVKGDQIVTSAHVGVADEDLWHGASSRQVHHAHALVRVGVDTDFFNVRHAFGMKDLFGPNSIRANSGGIHLDGLHVGLSCG